MSNTVMTIMLKTHLPLDLTELAFSLKGVKLPVL